MLKFFIPEKIPAHNKGEEAIFWGIMETLRFAPQKKVYLYSSSPEYDSRQYHGSAVMIAESLIPDFEMSKKDKAKFALKQIPTHVIFAVLYRLSRKLATAIFKGKLWRVYDEMDCVLAAHDSAFSAMHNILILFCNAIGKPIVIYGASITPNNYRRAWARFLTRFCLKRADLITLREKISARILVEKVGVKSEILKVTTDKAFLLTPADKEVSTSIFDKNEIRVGHDLIIGATFVYKTGILSTMPSMTRRHVEIMSQFIDFVAEKTGAKIVFFPHSIGPMEADDDRIASGDVYGQCQRKEQIRNITGDYSASTLKRMIGCCDFFIGERTHSLIAAVSMGVPSISISFPEDYRTLGILGETVGIYKWIYNVKDLNLLSLQDLFTRAWNNRAQIRELLHERIPQVIDMAHLNGIYLEEVLQRKVLIRS